MFDYKANMDRALIKLMSTLEDEELVPFEEYFEQRKAAMAERQELRFQEDWTMAIGMDVLRDKEIKDAQCKGCVAERDRVRYLIGKSVLLSKDDGEWKVHASLTGVFLAKGRSPEAAIDAAIARWGIEPLEGEG